MKTGHSMEDIHIFFWADKNNQVAGSEILRDIIGTIGAHSLEKLEAWIQQDQSGRHPATA